VIETLSAEMIATCLDAAGYRYYRSAESTSILVLFAARDLDDVATQVHFDVDDEILSVRVVTDRLFPPEQKARLEALCNEWQEEHRWPMVYVRTRTNGLLGVVCEGHLSTSGAGIHQALVDRFCTLQISCAHDFWDWLVRQDLEGLPPDADDLDEDLDALLDGPSPG